MSMHIEPRTSHTDQHLLVGGVVSWLRVQTRPEHRYVPRGLPRASYSIKGSQYACLPAATDCQPFKLQWVRENVLA